ncbi:CLASP amine-terminal protein (macronuclear) [Tetrahymena thermophila SB210]|uniref:CLASP amine-terminal protein n=1 Tax=Tetrahymena thermophila (strain SB210) TaxID=312017 RepID=Q24HY3_TETTS|nr:CLASP amine-terminal protein [Tetrahymena thermophila SB210]EAS07455.1 CLASP amine-terminal protein [Tetrahymena thermophila SB210]|eukprot:XP_001027697.1 CLASP amine-terminal protein [Tetrahymena thermophila SB210]
MGSNKDDIKPINLKTEKEITVEFQKISSVLENPNADWNKRLEALKTLQGMVVGNTWTHEVFMPNYQKLYNYINYQLKDLRSAVQKEACKLLSISAEKMQKSFESIAIKYVSKESLLNIINSGNKTLCENAHYCIQSIIEYCPSSSFMPQLLEECSSKSQQVRSRVSQYLVQILPELNQAQLDRFLPQLDSSISKGVQDANPEVRLNFRQVFGIYYSLYPQKAERILANQDTSIKKLLQEEISNFDNHQSTANTSNNRLLQQKSMDANIGNYLTTSNNTSHTQKLQQSVSMGNDDNHFVFATSSSSLQQNNLTVSSLAVGPTSRNLNKTPTAQQKANNIVAPSNQQAGMSASTSNNNLNKSRNGSNHHLSQERGIVNNLKQVSDQMVFQSNNKEKPSNGNSRVSPLRGGNRTDTVSPIKGNNSTLVSRSIGNADTSKPPVQTQFNKNTSQGQSYASSNFVNPASEQANYTIDLNKQKKNLNSQQSGNATSNLRQNNHQLGQNDNSASSFGNNSKIQNYDATDADASSTSRKVNAYRSQDPKKNQYNDNQTQQQMQGSRINSSLTRPPTQALQKKPIYQKRNSLTEENQNSQDSSQDGEKIKNQPKKYQNTQLKQNNQSSKVQNAKNKLPLQNNKQKLQYRDEDNLNKQNDLDDEDYEQYDRRSNYDQEESEEHYQDKKLGVQQDEEEEDNEDEQYNQVYEEDEDQSSNSYQKITQNQYFKNQNQLQSSQINKNTKQRRGNYSSTNIRGEYEEHENQNLSEEDEYVKHKKQTKSKISGQGLEDEDMIEKLAPKSLGTQSGQNYFNNANRVPAGDGGKRIVKSAMNSLKNSDQKNPTLGRQQQQQQQQQQQLQQSTSNNFQNFKPNTISSQAQILSGSTSTKHNNYMAATTAQQIEGDDKYLRLNISPSVDDDQVMRYTNNFKNKQQKGMTKSSQTLPKGQQMPQQMKPNQDQNITQPQQGYSWREDDLELLLDKINNNNSWSTRVSAFESMKEVIGELSAQNISASNQGFKQNIENEKVNPTLMKRIVHAHIDHLSDSHFKVISVCLDSLISIVSYDTTHVLPKLDQIIFKVLNNLIDQKDVVSSKANFLINILSKIFPAERLIEPIQKVLEQTNKNLLKICSLEVLMVTVKNAEEYYQTISNVRHTVQLMCMIIQENQNQKQMVLPCLGIILALRDHNQQGTLHSILSLTNQNQITALRNLSYEYAQDLEEDLRKYVQKENIKPTDKLTKSNMKQFQIDSNPPALAINGTQGQQQLIQVGNSATPNASQVNQMNATQNGGGMFNTKQQQQQPQYNTQKSQNNNNQQNGTLQNQKNRMVQNGGKISENLQAPIQNFDIQRIEEICACVSEFEQNESFIIQNINEILLNTIEFFKQNSRKTKEQSLKIFQSLFIRNYFYLTIQPHTVIECLSIYPYIPKDMDFYQIDEVIDEMIDCVPHLIFMKALVEKLNSEKPPQLQIMIKKISYILRKARKEEIRPFLDHIIDSFKLSINDQSPDVRKSVVFCLVDLKFLFQEEVDPYLHQFTGNQQKLVDIYVKKRQQNDGNGGLD